MHAGKKFGLLEALLWTRRAIYKFLIIATIPTVVYAVFGITSIPPTTSTANLQAHGLGHCPEVSIASAKNLGDHG